LQVGSDNQEKAGHNKVAKANMFRTFFANIYCHKFDYFLDILIKELMAYKNFFNNSSQKKHPFQAKISHMENLKKGILSRQKGCCKKMDSSCFYMAKLYYSSSNNSFKMRVAGSYALVSKITNIIKNFLNDFLDIDPSVLKIKITSCSKKGDFFYTELERTANAKKYKKLIVRGRCRDNNMVTKRCFGFYARIRTLLNIFVTKKYFK